MVARRSPHGQCHFDERNERARLIDFEIVHHKSMSAVSRHADDLLGFLQDMAGTVSGRQWMPFARCFLETYGRRPVIARLTKLLVVPTGIPGFWWKIRCNYLDRAQDGPSHRCFTTLARSTELSPRIQHVQSARNRVSPENIAIQFAPNESHPAAHPSGRGHCWCPHLGIS